MTRLEKGQSCVKKPGEFNRDLFRALRGGVQKRPLKNTQKWLFLGIFGQNLVLQWRPSV